jgi:nucleotide-binding universal stress UspA family protein
MTKYGVLVAVDGSPSSDAAVKWAARDAAIRRVPVTLMHVIVPVVVTWPVRYLEAGYRRSQEEHAVLVVALAEQIIRTETGDCDLVVRSEIRHGGAAPELTSASKSATTTVVGSRGLGTIGAGLLGSVSRSLLHYAASPVAVVRESAEEPDPALPVLLGIDGSAASETATELAFAEASLRGVDLVALHAWSDVSNVTPSESERLTLEQEGDEILGERLSGWQEQFPDVHVWRRIVPDRPAHWLIDASTRAQLVILGSRGRGEFTRLMLGSVSTTVAESSRTPVIVVGSAQRG